MESANGDVNDLITLNGCGYITQWPFPPNIKQCPNHLCKEVFECRSTAILHYQEQHANHSILCNICNKPVLLAVENTTGRANKFNFINHYKRVHPNMKIPYDFKNETETIGTETIDTETIDIEMSETGPTVMETTNIKTSETERTDVTVKYQCQNSFSLPS